MQILEEAKTKIYRVLSDYFHLLKEWERDFKPKSMDEIDARYEEAVQNLPKVEYQLDTLLWGLEEEKEMLVKDLGKWIAADSCYTAAKQGSGGERFAKKHT